MIWREIGLEAMQVLRPSRELFATLAGITWASAGVVLLLSLGVGLEAGLRQNITSTGDRWTTIIGQYARRGSLPVRKIQLDSGDGESLRRELGGSAWVAAEAVNPRAIVRANGQVRASLVSAGSAEIQQVKKLRIRKGRFFTELDDRARRRVAVMGHDVAASFFGTPEDAVGKMLKVDGLSFSVIGVLERVGPQIVVTVGANDDTIWLPLGPGLRTLDRRDEVDWIWLAPRPDGAPASFDDSVRQVIGASHNIQVGDLEALRVFSIVDMLAPLWIVIGALRIVLALVGVGTLSVAAIGIANWMATSVSERSTEIGVRRACGAAQRHILIQILGESILLTASAGFVGLSLGLAIVFALQQLPLPEFVPLPQARVSISLLSASTIVLAGALAGISAARQAARIEPSLAMRNLV